MKTELKFVKTKGPDEKTKVILADKKNWRYADDVGIYILCPHCGDELDYSNISINIGGVASLGQVNCSGFICKNCGEKEPYFKSLYHSNLPDREQVFFSTRIKEQSKPPKS